MALGSRDLPRPVVRPKPVVSVGDKLHVDSAFGNRIGRVIFVGEHFVTVEIATKSMLYDIVDAYRESFRYDQVRPC